MNSTNLDLSKFIPTSEKVTIENYPWGFKLKCTMYDSVDFDLKKGYRNSNQTIDPRNGRLNKPKKSTYSPFIMRYYDEVGHIKNLGLSFYHTEKIDQDCNVLFQLFPLLGQDEVIYLLKYIYQVLVVDFKATCVYKGAKPEDIKEFYQPILDLIKEAVKNPEENIFNKIALDKEGIYSKCPTEFNPFRVREYENGQLVKDTPSDHEKDSSADEA